MDVFSDSTDRRRATRLLLLAIIVLTLPCYCVGFVLLAYAPASSEDDTTRRPTNATLGGITSTPFLTPTYTPFGLTATSTQGGSPLLPTPGQLYLPTYTPFVWPTATLTLTPTFQPTSMPSLTKAPTLTPTNTLVPTNPPPPTNTSHRRPPILNHRRLPSRRFRRKRPPQRRRRQRSRSRQNRRCPRRRRSS